MISASILPGRATACCLVLLLLCAGSLFADEHDLPKVALQGRVFDLETSEPLVGATLRIPAAKIQVLSDALGYFSIQSLPIGTYEIEVSYLGYEPQSLPLELGEAAQAPVLFGLKPTPLTLQAVTISSPVQALEAVPLVAAIDLQNRPLRSAQDALRVVPGLFTAQHAGGGKAEQIFLRGFDIDHGTDLAITVDGMPVNMVSHAHGQGYADLHFLIPETIGRVNFGKGPYAVEQGNFATAGYVGFETKDALSQSEVKFEMGQYNTQRTLAMLDLLPARGQQRAYLAAEYVRSDGYFEASQQFERLNFLGKYTTWLGPKTRLEATASAFSSTWDASGQVPVRAIERGQISRFGALDSTEGGHTSRRNLSLELSRGLADGSLVHQQLYATQYAFDLYSNFTFFLEDSLRGDQIRQRENRQLLGYTGRWAQQTTQAKWTLNTEIGWGMRLDRIPESMLARTQNRETLVEPLALGAIRETNAQAFFREVLTRGPWQIELGLRYDQFSFGYEDALTERYDPREIRQGIFSPKAQLRYQLTPRLRVQGQLGRGFHANDTRTIMGASGRPLLPRAWGSDLGLWWKPSAGLLVQTAVWGLDLEQEFVYVGDAGIVEPSGATRRAGLDLSVRWQLLPSLYLDSDYTFSHARSREAEAEEAYIPLAPIHTAIAGLRWEPIPGYWASLRYRYLGDRPANEDFSLTATGYQLFDLVANASLGRITLQASVENLLNVEWREAQFETTSRLREEAQPVTEIHFTPGTPFFARLRVGYSW